VTFNFGVRHFW